MTENNATSQAPDALSRPVSHRNQSFIDYLKHRRLILLIVIVLLLLVLLLTAALIYVCISRRVFVDNTDGVCMSTGCIHTGN
jgi:hypothetical protein